MDGGGVGVNRKEPSLPPSHIYLCVGRGGGGRGKSSSMLRFFPNLHFLHPLQLVDALVTIAQLVVHPPTNQQIVGSNLVVA